MSVKRSQSFLSDCHVMQSAWCVITVKHWQLLASAVCVSDNMASRATRHRTLVPNEWLDQASETHDTCAKRGTWNDFQWHAE